MSSDHDAPCGRCGATTAISVNTDVPEGLRCLSCQKDGGDREKVEARIHARLEAIEVERFNLLAALVEVQNAA